MPLSITAWVTTEPDQCLSHKKEVDYASIFVNLILFEFCQHFICQWLGPGSEILYKYPYIICSLSFYESGSQLLVLSSLPSSCSRMGGPWPPCHPPPPPPETPLSTLRRATLEGRADYISLIQLKEFPNTVSEDFFSLVSTSMMESGIQYAGDAVLYKINKATVTLHDETKQTGSTIEANLQFF